MIGTYLASREHWQIIFPNRLGLSSHIHAHIYEYRGSCSDHRLVRIIPGKELETPPVRQLSTAPTSIRPSTTISHVREEECLGGGAATAAAAKYTAAGPQYLTTGSFATHMRGSYELRSRRASSFLASPRVLHDARWLRCDALMTYNRRTSHNASPSVPALQSCRRQNSFASSSRAVLASHISQVALPCFNALQRLA